MRHRTLTLVLLLLAASAVYVCPRLDTSAAGATPEPQQRRRGRARTAQRRAPARDYSAFRHSTPAHRKDACDSCHKIPTAHWARVRDRESAFLDVADYPEHESCLGCHRTQFFRGARPAICSVCHSVVSPRSGERHPFQNPPGLFARSAKAQKRAAGGSEFALNFPHDVHLDAMASNPAGAGKRANSCSACHETYFLRPGQKGAEAAAATPAAPAGVTQAPASELKDGLLMTSPAGHDSCFNCHWKGSREAEGGERPYASDCTGCHTPVQQAKAAAARGAPPPAGKDIGGEAAEGAGFADSFARAKLLRRDAVKFPHAASSHNDLDCARCHMSVSSYGSLDDAMYKVPVLSCGGGSSCHITPARDLNKEVASREKDASFQCVKCHVNLGRQKTPPSHLSAVGK